jgi:5-formyltetrahydrofolate cyclo-ligase
MSSKQAAGKAALRKQLRAARRALHPALHRLHSLQAARAIARLPLFGAGRRVAVYLPFDRETDTSPLIAAARRRGVRLYVPVVIDRRHRRMVFHPLSSRTRRGAFGIPVPIGGGAAVAARWLNLIVVPFVGVDAAGRRLGMGGGFYDRVAAFRGLRKTWRGPRLIGFGFDCQRVDAVGAEIWDLRFDATATQSGLQHYDRDETHESLAD